MFVVSDTRIPPFVSSAARSLYSWLAAVLVKDVGNIADAMVVRSMRVRVAAVVPEVVCLRVYLSRRCVDVTKVVLMLMIGQVPALHALSELGVGTVAHMPPFVLRVVVTVECNGMGCNGGNLGFGAI